MNSKVVKQFTVSVLEVMDTVHVYEKFKLSFNGNLDRFMKDSNGIDILEVRKFGSRLLFIVAEKKSGVTPDSAYRYLFERFGAIFDVNSNIPACIVRISGTKAQSYKLFIDDEICEKSSI